MQTSIKDIDYNAFAIFNDFDPIKIKKVFAHSTLRQLSQGEVFVEPGQSNKTLYLLVEGELQIVIENDGSKVSFPILPGECIGEMSIILERPTSAFAISKKESLVVCIPEEILWQEVLMTRAGLKNLLEMMAGRLQRTNHALIHNMEEQLKYKSLQKELETAGKIQSSIVPNSTHLRSLSPKVDVYGFIKQARVVGGDFYDAVLLDEDRVYLAIGDVSGKGMPAALFMMRTFTSLRMLISNNPNLGDVFPAVNNLLAINNEDMMFVSLFACVLNLKTGKFSYVNGGHNPPFVSLNGQDFQALVTKRGTLLGIRENSTFKVGELDFQPGDSLVMYTDGISEAMNKDQEMFDMDGIRATLDTEKYSTLQTLVSKLELAVQQFVGEAPPHDDLTVLALRYLGEQ